MNANKFVSLLYDKVVLKDLAKFLGGAISIGVIVDAFEDNMHLPYWWFSVFAFICIASIIPYLIFRIHDRIVELETGQKYAYRFSLKNQLGQFLTTYCILGIIILAILIKQWNSPEYSFKNELGNGLILVEVFENQTGDEDLDFIGPQTEFLINTYLEQNDINIVLPYQAKMVRNIANERKIASLSLLPDLWDHTGAEYIITGEYSKLGDSITINSRVTGTKTNRKKLFEPFTFHKDHLDQSLIEFAGYHTGFWSALDKSLDFENSRVWDSRELWIKALNVWPDYDKARSYLEKSIALDPDFLHAKFLYCSILRNNKQYIKLDSILNSFKQNEVDMNPREENLFKFYQAELQGDLSKALSYYEKEYQYDRHNWFYNSSMAIYYLHYANDPKKSLITFKELKYKYPESAYYKDRLEAMIDAHLRLNQLDPALQIIREHEEIAYNQQLCALKARALVIQGDLDQLRVFLGNYSSKSFDWKGVPIDTALVSFMIIREAYWKDADPILEEFGETLLSYTQSKKLSQYVVLENLVKYYLGKFDTLDSELLETDKQINMGSKELDSGLIDSLLANSGHYDHGETNYQLAKFYLAAGNNSESLKLLYAAHSEGLPFYRRRFAYDPDLRELFDHPGFIELTKPKG